MEKKSPQDIMNEYPSIKALIPTEEEQRYVNGMTDQHFRSENDPEAKTMGSCIYSETCPDALHALELVADKLGKDDSKDREFFKAQGAPESCLLPFARYYAVEGIRGKSRIVSVKDLEDDTKITLKPSPKGTPSLIIPESRAPEAALKDVNYATVICGPAQDREGFTVWTMHAGHPAPLIPIQKDEEGKPVKDAEGRMVVPEDTGWKYGDEIPVSEVRAKLGEDIFISIE